MISSVINIIDLAGSELLSDSEDRRSSVARDHSFANKSINILDTVITILSETNDGNEWIPYRDSKLTKLLMPYLEGNSKMVWICTIS